MEQKNLSETVNAMVPEAIRPQLSEQFVTSCELIAQYTHRLATQVFHDLRLDRFCGRQFRSVDAVIAAAGLSPQGSVPLAWLLETLALHGQVERRVDASGAASFRISPGFEPFDPLVELGDSCLCIGHGSTISPGGSGRKGTRSRRRPLVGRGEGGNHQCGKKPLVSAGDRSYGERRAVVS